MTGQQSDAVVHCGTLRIHLSTIPDQAARMGSLRREKIICAICDVVRRLISGPLYGSGNAPKDPIAANPGFVKMRLAHNECASIANGHLVCVLIDKDLHFDFFDGLSGHHDPISPRPPAAPRPPGTTPSEFIRLLDKTLKQNRALAEHGIVSAPARQSLAILEAYLIDDVPEYGSDSLVTITGSSSNIFVSKTAILDNSDDPIIITETRGTAPEYFGLFDHSGLVVLSNDNTSMSVAADDAIAVSGGGDGSVNVTGADDVLAIAIDAGTTDDLDPTITGKSHALLSDTVTLTGTNDPVMMAANLSLTANNDPVTFSGSDSVVVAPAAGNVSLSLTASNDAITISGTNDKVVVAEGCETITFMGTHLTASNNSVTLSGTSQVVTLSGTNDIVNVTATITASNSGTGDTVSITGVYESVTVSGTATIVGGTLSLTSSGDTNGLSAAGQTVAAGSGDTVTLTDGGGVLTFAVSNSSVSVSGSNDTVFVACTGGTVTLGMSEGITELPSANAALRLTAGAIDVVSITGQDDAVTGDNDTILFGNGTLNLAAANDTLSLTGAGEAVVVGGSNHTAVFATSNACLTINNSTMTVSAASDTVTVAEASGTTGVVTDSAPPVVTAHNASLNIVGNNDAISVAKGAIADATAAKGSLNASASNEALSVLNSALTVVFTRCNDTVIEAPANQISCGERYSRSNGGGSQITPVPYAARQIAFRSRNRLFASMVCREVANRTTLDIDYAEHFADPAMAFAAMISELERSNCLGRN